MRRTGFVVLVFVCALLLVGSAGAATPAQKFNAYLAAVAKARQPSVAMYPRVQAALSDLSRVDLTVTVCAPSYMDIGRYARSLDSFATKVKRLPPPSPAMKRPNASLYIGLVARSSLYSSLYGPCADRSDTDPQANADAARNLRNAISRAASDLAESNGWLSEWRLSVVEQAKRLGVKVPQWVYGVGVR